MNYINLIITIIFAVFLCYEGFNTIKTFREHERMVKETLETHKNAKVCKDYLKWNIFYFALGTLSAVWAGLAYMQGEILEMILFSLFFLFTFIFAMEMIVSKTVVFYDSGFMFKLTHYKYRFVTHVGEGKKSLKGIPVKVTGEDQILLSKKAIDELNHYLEAYKKRKQENVEARRAARKEAKK